MGTLSVQAIADTNSLTGAGLTQKQVAAIVTEAGCTFEEAEVEKIPGPRRVPKIYVMAGLATGVVILPRENQRMRRRQQVLETSLRAAAGACNEILEQSSRPGN